MNVYNEIKKFTTANKELKKIPLVGLPDDGEIVDRVKAVEEFLKSENAEGVIWEEYFSDTYEKLYALAKDGNVYDLLSSKVTSPLEVLSDFILVKEQRGNKRADIKHYSETDLKRKDKNFRGKNQKSRQYNLFFECELNQLNNEGETVNEYANAPFFEDFDSVFAGSGFEFLEDEELKEVAYLKGTGLSDKAISELTGLSLKQVRNRREKVVKRTIEHFSDEGDLCSYNKYMNLFEENCRKRAV